ncbi:hypothetical protein HYT23_01350 [Candidatus Pacearchaeota archaeon]|nr:hypothetical protein [Candidatus Pacearchaeota archaeon]
MFPRACPEARSGVPQNEHRRVRFLPYVRELAVFSLIVNGLRGLNRRRGEISNFVLFDILHMVNVFDVGWKSFSQIRNKFHEFLRI